jgi:hypothetical protein
MDITFYSENEPSIGAAVRGEDSIQKVGRSLRLTPHHPTIEMTSAELPNSMSGGILRIEITNSDDARKAFIELRVWQNDRGQPVAEVSAQTNQKTDGGHTKWVRKAITAIWRTVKRGPS